MIKIKQTDFVLSILFLSFFLLNLSNFATSINFLKEYLLLIKIVSYFLFIGPAFVNFLYFLFNKTRLSFLLYIILFIVGGAAGLYISKDIIFFEILLLFSACVRIPVHQLIRIDFFVKLIVLILNFIFDFFGFVSGMVISTRDNVIRESFGFHNPNTLGLFLMILFFELFILFPNKKKIIFPTGLLFMLINYKYADSRASTYCMLLFITLYYITKFSDQFLESWIIKFLFKNSFTIFLLLSIFTTIFYESLDANIANLLNNWTSGRLGLQSMYWENYPISILGNDIIFNRTLDNGYIKLILKYGLLMTAAYMIIWGRLFNNFYNKKNYDLILVLFCFTVYTLFESYSLYAYANIFLLAYLKESKSDELSIGFRNYSLL